MDSMIVVLFFAAVLVMAFMIGAIVLYMLWEDNKRKKKRKEWEERKQRRQSTFGDNLDVLFFDSFMKEGVALGKVKSRKVGYNMRRRLAVESALESFERESCECHDSLVTLMR